MNMYYNYVEKCVCPFCGLNKLEWIPKEPTKLPKYTPTPGLPKKSARAFILY